MAGTVNIRSALAQNPSSLAGQWGGREEFRARANCNVSPVIFPFPNTALFWVEVEMFQFTGILDFGWTQSPLDDYFIIFLW